VKDEPKRFVAKDQRKLDVKPKVVKQESKSEEKGVSDESSKGENLNISSVNRTNINTEVTKSYSNQVIFYVNGTKYMLENPDPFMSLNDFLRSTPGLQGTKHMCYQVYILFFFLLFSLNHLE